MAAAGSEDGTPTNSLLLTTRRTFVELPTAWALRLHPGLAQGVGESGRETGSPSKLPQGEGGANAKLLTVPNSCNFLSVALHDHGRDTYCAHWGLLVAFGLAVIVVGRPLSVDSCVG